MDLGLQGRNVLITGGSRGIGLCTARAFAGEGCDLGIMARGEDVLEAAAGELRAKGGHVVAVAGDICVPEDAARFIDTCAGELGGIDVLVNNAVGFEFGNPDRTLVRSTDDSWRAAHEGVVVQAVRMIRLAVPHLQRSDAASIVNVASISGWIPQLAGRGEYGSTKGAIIGLAERFALELVHDGIRVNTVSPGSIHWPGGSWDKFREKHPDDYAEYVREGFPMGRLGKPEEVADAIVFLASPRANWINGRHIPVDGLEQPVPIRQYRGW